MSKFTVSFLGRDCPGIVAAISSLLGAIHCNIEAMSQTMLGGEFAAIFVIKTPENNTDIESLKSYLVEGLAQKQVDLSVLVRSAIEGQWGKDLECDPFVVTVDGPDKPGLIGGMSRVFAMHGVNIENLRAILGGIEAGQALFIFEIMVPKNIDLGRLRRELSLEAQKLGLRVSVQHRNIFEAIHRVEAY